MTDAIVLGFDPDGEAAFGVAILSGSRVTAGTVSSVREAMDRARAQCGGRKVVAAGIDTLLHWSTDRGSWRPAARRTVQFWTAGKREAAIVRHEREARLRPLSEDRGGYRARAAARCSTRTRKLRRVRARSLPDGAANLQWWRRRLCRIGTPRRGDHLGRRYCPAPGGGQVRGHARLNSKRVR
jgi:hypothetical protein